MASAKNIALKFALVLAIAAPVYCHAAPGEEQYLEIGNTCAQAEEPLSCMESYGFRCHRGRRLNRSVEAVSVGCNLHLGDGRAHFVQMLYDDGGWNVEVERTYVLEPVEQRRPDEDTSLALSSYIERKMEGFSMHSSGGGTSDRGWAQEFYSGTRRIDGRVAARVMCGIAFGGELAEPLSEATSSECQQLLLRTVKRLSQPQATGTYRVAAPSEFEWKSRFVDLVSGDTALVVEGRYTFTEIHTPCLWISDCCSSDGIVYLDSCRAPSETELEAIRTCLSETGRPRTDAFTTCLQKSGVKAWCEERADGSQVCY